MSDFPGNNLKDFVSFLVICLIIGLGFSFICIDFIPMIIYWLGILWRG